MRLNLYWRGRDVVDIDLHIWKRRGDGPEPKLPRIEAMDGGQAERAEPFGDPDTTVCFGFGRPES